MSILKLADAPDNLKPYIFHGIELSNNNKNAVGDCPFCGKESKFSVRVENGLWKCWACPEGNEKGGGNPMVFIRCLWEASRKVTQVYAGLAQERNLMSANTLEKWGACRSISSGDWMVPAFNAKKEITQLYRYIPIKGKRRLLATPTLKQHLYGLQHYDKKKPIIYLVEGPWDAMALWELLAKVRRTESGFTSTMNRSKSLLAEANVLASPGCNIFFDTWVSLFANKVVYLSYDNDHPRINQKTNQPIPPQGLTWMQRVAEILHNSNMAPKEIHWLQWADVGYDTTLSSGFDVRDAITKGLTPATN